jgi:hypothetical protein
MCCPCWFHIRNFFSEKEGLGRLILSAPIRGTPPPTPGLFQIDKRYAKHSALRDAILIAEKWSANNQRPLVTAPPFFWVVCWKLGPPPRERRVMGALRFAIFVALFIPTATHAIAQTSDRLKELEEEAKKDIQCTACTIEANESVRRCMRQAKVSPNPRDAEFECVKLRIDWQNKCRPITSWCAYEWFPRRFD